MESLSLRKPGVARGGDLNDNQAPLTPALEVPQGGPGACDHLMGSGSSDRDLYAGQKVPGPGICSNLTWITPGMLSRFTPMFVYVPNRIWAAAAAAAKSLQSCPTLCNPIDSSPPGSPVPGILQARTLKWVAVSFSNA